MKVYAIKATDVFSDNPHIKDIVEYYINKDLADKALELFNTKSRIYDEFHGYPMFQYYDDGEIEEIEVKEQLTED